MFGQLLCTYQPTNTVSAESTYAMYASDDHASLVCLSERCGGNGMIFSASVLEICGGNRIERFTSEVLRMEWNIESGENCW